MPSAGFEPTTYSLRVNCSSNWAKKAVKRAGAAPASWPYRDQALLLCKRFMIICVIPISQQDSNLRALRTHIWLVRRFPYGLLRSHSLTIWPYSGMRYGMTGSLPIGRNRTSSFTPPWCYRSKFASGGIRTLLQHPMQDAVHPNELREAERAN